MTEREFKNFLKMFSGDELIDPISVVWEYEEADLFFDDLYFNIVKKPYLLPAGVPIRVEKPFALVDPNLYKSKYVYLIPIEKDDIYYNRDRIDSLAPSWNKSVLTIYSKKYSERYKKQKNKYLEWFDDNEIKIDEIDTLFKISSKTKLDIFITNIFKAKGSTWTINFYDKEKTIKHTLGMNYIYHLIKNQNKEIPALDLYYAVSSNVLNIDKELSKVPSIQLESDEGLSTDSDDVIELADQKTINAIV